MRDEVSPCADTSHMYTVHAMFRREFALLPGLVRTAPENDRERSQIVTDHIRLMSLVLHEHHSGEDAVLWPRLLIRAPREIAPIVHLVEGHHEGIEVLTAKIDVLLTTWNDSAASESGEALAEALGGLAVALYEHMDLEEKLVLSLVERHIFAYEWEQMIEHGAANIPPELGPLLAGMLMYEGGLEVVPPEIRTVLVDVAQQTYSSYAERVHGTATPPRSSDVVIGTPFVGTVATEAATPGAVT